MQVLIRIDTSYRDALVELSAAELEVFARVVSRMTLVEREWPGSKELYVLDDDRKVNSVITVATEQIKPISREAYAEILRNLEPKE